nr:PREDICTED: lysosomal thioesterase PPT2-B-like [Bemisia tabaci]XP_018897026.1 PREDICTED: lysosomal thioesterase PPT2-B-like [Bemisia tabaci]XP_018897027.1 PREDICTED: lysosomal thioesterase PPT2-B-like [Bemisia tabaci]XP_018897028.1 PREDICTED: lysosomal thioesterase PPT2-B-like [Bemisia tabaci]
MNHSRVLSLSLFWLVVSAEIKYGTSEYSSNCSPVFLIHGLTRSDLSLKYLERRIHEFCPGVVTYNTPAFSFVDSFAPLQVQVNGLLEAFNNFSKAHSKFHLVTHSQGTLIGRALIQASVYHNVCNYISLGGIHSGTYGIPTIAAELTPLGEIPVERMLTTALLYTPTSMETLSIANFWHDPDNALYLEKNTYLPRLNNQIPSNESYSQKEALLRLNKFVTLYGQGDGFVFPWESGDFSFYKIINNTNVVVNYTEWDFYDTLGLRTLDETGRFIKHNISGVEHLEWPMNDNVIDNYVLPYLGYCA